MYCIHVVDISIHVADILADISYSVIKFPLLSLISFELHVAPTSHTTFTPTHLFILSLDLTKTGKEISRNFEC